MIINPPNQFIVVFITHVAAKYVFDDRIRPGIVELSSLKQPTELIWPVQILKDLYSVMVMRKTTNNCNWKCTFGAHSIRLYKRVTEDN